MLEWEWEKLGKGQTNVYEGKNSLKVRLINIMIHCKMNNDTGEGGMDGWME